MNGHKVVLKNMAKFEYNLSLSKRQNLMFVQYSNAVQTIIYSPIQTQAKFIIYTPPQPKKCENVYCNYLYFLLSLLK